MRELAPPSPWLTAHLPELASGGGPVLDLACGRGRHALAVAARGLPVVGIDRDPAFLRELRQRAGGARILAVRSDLEIDREIPVRSESCAAILVFRFLFRPLAPAIVEALAPGGILLYETFTVGQRDLPAGPRNPAFLLERGELPRLFPALRVIASEEDVSVARLAARKP